MHDTLDLPDLDQCAREPIAFLDHIQSFGFLIGLTNDWTIIRASANLQEFLGTEAAHAIGMKVDRLIAQPALHDVRNRLAGLTGESGTERLYGVRLTTDRRLFDLACTMPATSWSSKGSRAAPTSPPMRRLWCDR
jgi:light-regulated signal transduction histidine kinase (bacteriophytochrome)